MLTRLAGGNGVVHCLPAAWRENEAVPEPPGSIARGRWAAATELDVLVGEYQAPEVRREEVQAASGVDQVASAGTTSYL